MGLISYLQNRRSLSEYQRLRKIGRFLNQELVNRLPRTALLTGAKRLGLRTGKQLVFSKEEEMSILFDYCLYSYRKGGKTLFESLSEENPPNGASDLMVLLRAMKMAHYSVFQVKTVQRRQGATLFDILRAETIHLMDIGIGSTAVPGMFFAGRVLPIGEYYMTSGAFIPLSPKFFERRVIPALEKFCGKAAAEDSVEFAPPQEASFSAQIIRAALKEGQLDRMGYE